MAKNYLYYGDNLDIMRRYLKDERQVNVTFKKAPRVKEEQLDILQLPMG